MCIKYLTFLLIASHFTSGNSQVYPEDYESQNEERRISDETPFSAEDEVTPEVTSSTPSTEEEEHLPSKSPLNLSSYELYTVVDLLVEISLRPCHHLNRPVLRALKKYLAYGLKGGPSPRFQHAQFFTNYKNLVQCLNTVIELYPIKSSDNVESINSPRGNLRPKRSVDELDNEMPRQNENFNGDDLSFESFLAYLGAIAFETCTGNVQQDKQFIVSALQEILHWISEDGTANKQAQLKYLQDSTVIKGLDKCLHSNVFISTSTSPTTVGSSKGATW